MSRTDNEHQECFIRMKQLEQQLQAAFEELKQIRQQQQNPQDEGIGSDSINVDVTEVKAVDDGHGMVLPANEITSQTSQLDPASSLVSSDCDGAPTPYRSLSTLTNISSPAPVTKRGYLFKWLDRSIGWSGTKWALRFVVLEKGKLAYYGSHTDTSPRYVLSLRGCAVRDDGWKLNRRWAPSPLFGKVKKKNGASDGHDKPSFDEPGAYFFLLSIYQRPHDRDTGLDFDRDDGDKDYDDENDHVVPLLRFSTPSMAERNQWIQLIDEACAYCETDEFLINEAIQAAEVDRQVAEQKKMALAMPEAKEGTLPPLFFAPPATVNTVLSKMHRSRPSFTKDPSKSNLLRGRHRKDEIGASPGTSSLFRNKNVDADAADRKSTKGYPPSKPMHRVSAPSFLAYEAPVQNYRGFFNLGAIILTLSNIKMIHTSLKVHGFVLMKLLNPKDLFMYLYDLPRNLYNHPSPWEEFPLVVGCSFLYVCTIQAYVIEKLLSRKYISESIGMLLHHINAHGALIIPLLVVWNKVDEPHYGVIVLMHAATTWMKLVSYFLANQDYRSSAKHQQQASLLGLVENLDDDEATLSYPDNVTVRNILYFWCAPTLTYQIAFPKSDRIRLWVLGNLMLQMFGTFTLFTFGATQVVGPALRNLVDDLEQTGGQYTIHMMAEYWLRLSVANTYLWLLMFYLYFHLFLNFLAELLRFGDRVFYKDWWNSAEVSAFWRLWNLPVHYWLIRHLYFPCIRLRISKGAATFIVFLVSAIMHEVLVSVPFHIIRPWSFLGMMMQIPLVAATKYLYRKYPGSSVGNLIFWLSFCIVGQPMAILLYTVDYNYANRLHGSMTATFSNHTIDFKSMDYTRHEL